MQGRTLQSYMQRRFELAFYHKFSIADLENLPVWEFDLLYDQVVMAIQAQQDSQKGISLSDDI